MRGAQDEAGGLFVLRATGLLPRALVTPPAAMFSLLTMCGGVGVLQLRLVRAPDVTSADHAVCRDNCDCECSAGREKWCVPCAEDPPASTVSCSCGVRVEILDAARTSRGS